MTERDEWDAVERFIADAEDAIIPDLLATGPGWRTRGLILHKGLTSDPDKCSECGQQMPCPTVVALEPDSWHECDQDEL